MKNEKKKELGGLFVFNDEKTNQTVYFDILKKQAYIITSEKEQKYAIYATRYIIEVAIAIFICSNYKLSYYWGIGVFVVAFIIGELIFRYKYLYKLPILKHFQKKKKEAFFIRISKNTSMSRALIITILSIVLAVVGIINFYVTKYNPYGAIMFLFECCMAVAGGLIAILYIIIIIIKLIKKI